MFCLSKRPNGTYYIFYNLPNGKRTCITTKTKYKADATKFLMEFKDELKKRDEQRLIPISLNQLINEFTSYSKTIHTSKTVKAYIQALSFLRNYFNDVLISSITHNQMSKYFENRLNTSSIYQARKDLICFNSFFNYAIRQKYFLENPCNGIKRFKIPEKEPLYFTEPEFQTLLRVINNETIKDMVIVSINTGIRQMELLTLRWSQINFKEGILTLNNQFAITKSKRIRSIPLNVASLQIFTKLELKRDEATNELVFTHNGQMFNQNYIGMKFKEFVIKAGLNSKLHWHSLRHTFASWLIQKDVSVYTVQKLLGHQDIKTTSIYAHLKNSDLLNSLNKLNN